MRPGAEFFAVSHLAGAPTVAPAHGLINGTVAPHSPWQSPVPYLFGGLAAMLGLIAFALLILACSYWKLSGCPAENKQCNRVKQHRDGTRYVGPATAQFFDKKLSLGLPYIFQNLFKKQGGMKQADTHCT
ncbi:hypothetical protein TRIUR3_28536 [Triticum urartu]|uniref:Uncharacterized protein n=2 Tax=Triticum TaxID=4564 RepID=A0A9R0ZMU3_TRITD|nr:hypothetical protein TRIUR3_28536 [Triticum urartu]VAI80658.1 unnamed protein product [Triticum turgidum subsp. durum]